MHGSYRRWLVECTLTHKTGSPKVLAMYYNSTMYVLAWKMTSFAVLQCSARSPQNVFCNVPDISLIQNLRTTVGLYW